MQVKIPKILNFLAALRNHKKRSYMQHFTSISKIKKTEVLTNLSQHLCLPFYVYLNEIHLIPNKIISDYPIRLSKIQLIRPNFLTATHSTSINHSGRHTRASTTKNGTRGKRIRR